MEFVRSSLACSFSIISVPMIPVNGNLIGETRKEIGVLLNGVNIGAFAIREIWMDPPAV
jgi:hypothetical protein